MNPDFSDRIEQLKDFQSSVWAAVFITQTIEKERFN